MERKFKTRITELLGIEHPILCGGMQWVSRADFVAEICNAGGIGFITAETFDSADDLRKEIRKMRTLTDKPFGVNISMIPELMYNRTFEFCDVVCEEGVRVVETAGNTPKPLMPKLKEAGITVVHKCTSVRHAETAQRLGVDAVTLIGYGSGGHVGLDDVVSFVLIPLAVSRLDIPVIAGGGIGDGKGFLGALAMGAEAILLGTAFFVTKESPVHPAIKERLLQASELDTTLVMRSIRHPARCLKNRIAGEILAIEERGGTLEEVVIAASGKRGKLAYDVGDPEIAAIGCGQSVGLLDKMKTVREVVEDIITEAGELLDRLNRLTVS